MSGLAIFLILAALSGGFLFLRARAAPGVAGPARPPEKAQWGVLAMCRGRAWFDPNSNSDLRLTTYGPDEPQVMLEVDDLAPLEAFCEKLGASPGKIDFLVFQNWGEEKNNSRAFFWFSKERAARLGQILRPTRFKKLLLICTTCEAGALRVLADELGRPMEMVGVCWYFSGDDLTDDPTFPYDIGYLATRLELERLSILTALSNDTVNQQLASALAPASSLRIVRVFEKDDAKSWPQMRIPGLPG